MTEYATKEDLAQVKEELRDLISLVRELSAPAKPEQTDTETASGDYAPFGFEKSPGRFKLWLSDGIETTQADELSAWQEMSDILANRYADACIELDQVRAVPTDDKITVRELLDRYTDEQLKGMRFDVLGRDWVVKNCFFICRGHGTNPLRAGHGEELYDFSADRTVKITQYPPEPEQKPDVRII